MSNDQCQDLQEKKSVLSIRQRKAVAVLLTTTNIEKAASQLKLNPSTIHRWLKQPTFQEALNSARAETVQRAKNILQAASEAAVKILVSIMASSTSDNTRIRAAELILEYSLSDMQLNDLIEKAQKLETIFKKYREEGRL